MLSPLLPHIAKSKKKKGISRCMQTDPLADI